MNETHYSGQRMVGSSSQESVVNENIRFKKRILKPNLRPQPQNIAKKTHQRRFSFPITGGPGYQNLITFSNPTKDPDFLSQLELNSRLKLRTLADVFQMSTRVSFQLCAVVFFYVVYYHLRYENVYPGPFLNGCWLTCVIGHIMYQYHKFSPLQMGDKDGWTKLFPKEHMRVTIVFIVFSYQMAPILRTLTATISTDTIHAVAVGLTALHLLTNDYGVSGFLVSKTVSMNAAIIGGICLSSRLTSDTHALTLITLAVQSFILFPMFAKVIWNSSASLVFAVTVVSYACVTISINTFLIYITIMLFVTVIIPVVFVAQQKYKCNLHGPWDEAIPDREGRLDHYGIHSNSN